MEPWKQKLVIGWGGGEGSGSAEECVEGENVTHHDS